MTKDSKLPHISDSASGGKGESMAKEIRLFPIQKGLAIPWALAEVAYRTYAAHYSGQSLERLAERDGFGWHEFLHLYFGDVDWKLTDAQVEERWNANELQKVIAECSHLASRVERLEMALLRCKYKDCDKAHCFKNDPCQSCEVFNRVLAGAHAEEKPNDG